MRSAVRAGHLFTDRLDRDKVASGASDSPKATSRVQG